jgi:hypothetical protein
MKHIFFNIFDSFFVVRIVSSHDIKASFRQRCLTNAPSIVYVGAILSHIGVWTMKKFNFSRKFVIIAVMSIKIKYYIDLLI